MRNRELVAVITLASAGALGACGGRTSNDAAATSMGGAGGAAASGGGSGAAGNSSSGGAGGGAGADLPADSGSCFPSGRCRFARGGFYTSPAPECPRPFDAKPPITATGPSVLSRIAFFLENAPSVVPSGDVPDVATAAWAGAEATAILDRHLTDNLAPPGFMRFLSSWLAAPPTVSVLSDPRGWPLRLALAEASLPGLLTERPVDPKRVGILTDRELLTARPGITTRGAWVYTIVRCEEFPPPPPNKDHHPPDFPGVSDLTRREKLERSIANSSGGNCRACHSIADSLGVAFEHFDEMGSYRDLDNGKPVDSSGNHGGIAGLDPAPGIFKSIDDLAPLLASSCDVAMCFTATMFNDALGVHPGPGEAPPYSAEELNYVANRFADSNFSIRELVKAIVESPTFLR